MTLARLQLAVVVSSGGRTIPLVRTEDRPLGFVSERGELTAQTLLEPCDQHHVAQRRLDGEAGALLGGGGPSEETKGRDKERAAL